MSVKRKGQHTIPRAYLAQFIDPDTPSGREPYVWVYERGEDEPYARAPKRLTVRSYYYSYTPPGGDRDDVVEEMLSRVESAALPVIRNLDAGREPADLSEDERGAVAHFVGFLDVRVPGFRETVEEFAGKVMKDIGRVSAQHPEYYERVMRQAHREKGLEPPKDIEAVRQWTLDGEYQVSPDPLLSLQMMLHIQPMAAGYAYNYLWRVLAAPVGSAFVTSDCPLVRITTARLPRWMGVGWETPWMEATLPLSPRTCLLISLHRPEGRECATSEQVREVNLRTAAHAQKQVFSSRRLLATDLDCPTGWSGWQPVTDALREPIRAGDIHMSDADAGPDTRMS